MDGIRSHEIWGNSIGQARGATIVVNEYFCLMVPNATSNCGMDIFMRQMQGGGRGGAFHLASQRLG